MKYPAKEKKQKNNNNNKKLANKQKHYFAIRTIFNNLNLNSSRQAEKEIRHF